MLERTDGGACVERVAGFVLHETLNNDVEKAILNHLAWINGAHMCEITNRIINVCIIAFSLSNLVQSSSCKHRCRP